MFTARSSGEVPAQDRSGERDSADAKLGLTGVIGLVPKARICFAMNCKENSNGNEARGMSMELSQGSLAEVACGTRRYRSPNRILVRSFRIGRDKWKVRHHVVQAKLEQVRQLSAERGTSRDRWREDCKAAVTRAEAAEALAAQRLTELEQIRVRLADHEAAAQKKTR